MTTQTSIATAETGLTLTAKLFAVSAPDTVAYTADTVVERTNAKSQYVCTYGEAAAISGDFTQILFDGDRVAAIGKRTFAGVDGEVATTTLETVELDSATIEAIGTDFLAHELTKGTAGTIERALWQLSKTTTSVDGTVVDNAANSATTFHSNITAATGQYDHQLLVFTSGSLEGEARPIDTFASSGGVIVLQEALTAEPAADDEFLILPYHVHPIDEIQAGLARTGNDGDTLETLSDQIDGISVGTGTGARTVTITVNDGTAALQNARVRLTEGANTFSGLTNASGVVVFNVDDATYAVAITKSGYTYSGTTLVVDGNETVTYSITAVSVTPPTNPDLSAVVVLCLGTDFEPELGVTIDLRIKTMPTGSTNTAFPGLKQTATSDANGIATLEAPKGSVCEWKRGKEDAWTEITIGSGEQTSVTSIIGSRY